MAQVELARIRVDGGTQARAALDNDVMAELAEAYEAKEPIPPVTVFDDETDLWMADGFHRLGGAKRAGLTAIEADVHKGTLRDAILFAVGANHDHGLRRTNLDKRTAVQLLLQDPEWVQRSDSWIAKACRVGDKFVANVRVTASSNSQNTNGNEDDSNGDESNSGSGNRTSNGENGGQSDSKEGSVGNNSNSGSGKRTGRDGKRYPARKPRKKKQKPEERDEKEKPDQTMEEIISEENSVLESFCRKVMKIVDEELPDTPWLKYMNRRESALQHFKNAVAAVRSAKCQCPCPMCQGEGCDKCQDSGRVTTYMYQQLVG